MRLVKAKDTGPELAVRRLVHSMGYRHRKQRSDLPGRPDLAFIGRRRAIFVHGCFWHRHDCSRGRMPKSRADFWVAKLESNQKRDVMQVQALAAMGWDSMVIWECELSDMPAVGRRIRAFLDA